MSDYRPGIARKVMSHDSGRWLLCCWADCERQGVTLHQVRHHDHARGVPCDLGKHTIMVFCSERHKQLFVNSHIEYGRLPAGMRFIF